MSAAQDVLLRARRMVNGPRRDLMTTTTGSITASGTTLAVAAATGIAAQTIVEVGAEQMFVTVVAALNLTVLRGVNGTIPAAHASGAFVLVNPTLTMWDLTQAANAELNSLSSPENGLFRVAFTDISSPGTRLGYDLDVKDGFIGVIGVKHRRSSNKDWMTVPRSEYQVHMEASLTDFASGVGLVFPNGPRSNMTHRVWYRTAYNQLSGDPAEDVPARTGITQQAEDIISLGAAIRVAESRPIARADPFSPGDTRRAGEASTSDALQSTSALRLSRTRRIAEEAARLKLQWGAL